jgi:hypothetical protein
MAVLMVLSYRPGPSPARLGLLMVELTESSYHPGLSLVHLGSLMAVLMALSYRLDPSPARLGLLMAELTAS